MSFYDIVMLVVLLAAMLFGYWKGLAWQIASVAAVVVSYVLAYRFRDQVASYIQAEPPLNRIGAMLLIFVASSLLIWVLYAYVNRSLKKAELGGFNRQMGALVGGVTGILLCMVITIFSVSLLGQQAHDSIHQSRIGPYMIRGISQVSMIVPDELAVYIDPHIERFHQHLEQGGGVPLNSYPSLDLPGSANGLAGADQSQPTLFSPNSGNSFLGNWTVVPGEQNNGQASFTSSQNGQSSQPGLPRLPSFNVEVDTNDLLNRSGQWLQNQFETRPPSNNNPPNQ